MARKVNMSQLKSQLRQLQNKQRQAINHYNQQVRQYNNAVRQYINNYNSAVNRYNSAVRLHNSNVVHNKQVIQREINRLRSINTTTTNHTYAYSLSNMQKSYTTVYEFYDNTDITPEQERILDLVDTEQANSLLTANMVLGDDTPDESMEDIEIENKLGEVSPDLLNRWKGAVFSLNPNNPDAARHFCTSARELFTQFIELKASDNDVFTYNPNAARTNNGNATRKEKIHFMMRHLAMNSSVTDFADADIDNILSLFHVLSDGTHGSAGRYDYKVLLQVKKRVEQGINFLCEIAS